MRGASNFHQEWGCLAPAPGFIRTARVALAATMIGATVGAGVVFSLLGQPTTESTVSARTLVRPVKTASAPPGQMEAHEQPILNQARFALRQVDAKQTADATGDRSSARATTGAVERVTVSASTATPADDDTLAAPRVAVVGLPARDPAPTNIKSTKKLNTSWRNAFHGEPLRPLTRGHDLKKSFDGYRESGAQVGNRNVESRSGWSDWDRGWADQGTTYHQGSPADFLLGLGRIVTQAFGQSSP
jgi:hypothetical protein